MLRLVHPTSLPSYGSIHLRGIGRSWPTMTTRLIPSDDTGRSKSWYYRSTPSIRSMNYTAGHRRYLSTNVNNHSRGGLSTNFRETMTIVMTQSEATARLMAFEQVQNTILKLCHADRTRPNYSPTLEDRLVGPATPQLEDTELFALPSGDHFRLTWSLSPILAVKDVTARLRLLGKRTSLVQSTPSFNPTISKGQKYLHAGQIFLTGAWGLNELAVSLRLQGKVEESKQVARLSALRTLESALLFIAAEASFMPHLNNISVATYMSLQLSILQADLRYDNWSEADQLITRALQGKPPQTEDPNMTMAFAVFHYTTLLFQAEALQTQKRYQEAIAIWEAVIKQERLDWFAGLRESTVVDATNQLIHCYLQVNDVNKAWETYELGLTLDEKSRKLMDPTVYTPAWIEKQTERYDSARADAEIMKQRILAAKKSDSQIRADRPSSDQPASPAVANPRVVDQPQTPTSSSSSSSQSEVDEYFKPEPESNLKTNHRINWGDSAFWLIQAGGFAALFYYLSQKFIGPDGIMDTNDQIQLYVLDILRQDRTLSNYSPALEDRLVEPPTGSYAPAYFLRFPSFNDLRLIWSISPGLMMRDVLVRLRLMSDRQRLESGEMEYSKPNVSPEESRKLVEQGKKYMNAGRICLLSAKALNELAISLRLQGAVAESTRIGHLSYFRCGESVLLFEAAYKSVCGQVLEPGVYDDLSMYFLESVLRYRDWPVADELLPLTMNLKYTPKTNNQTDIDAVTFLNDRIYNQTAILRAEMCQIRKQYKEAIQAWEDVLQHSKAIDSTARMKYHMGQFDMRDLTAVEVTTQLSHCYLQVDDVKSAWSTYELGLQFERVEVEALEKMRQSDPTDIVLQDVLVIEKESYEAARADAEIMKQKILERTNGRPSH